MLGDALGPAVELSESEVAGLEAPSPPGTWIVSDGTTFVFGEEYERKPCLFRVKENQPELILPKWGEEKGYLGWAHSFAVTGEHFFFLIGKQSDTSVNFGDFHLYLFDRVSLELAHHIHVGDTDGILQEPTFSRLVVVEETVFFCWSKRNPEKSPSLVLVEVPPSGKLKKHMIREEFHWNALVDIAAEDGEVFAVYDLPDSDNANSAIHLYRHRGKDDEAE